jgi:Icc-related predicted phosphoesterase
MRLWILSDLHHEMQPKINLTIPEADVCVLAGDIDRPLAASVDWAAQIIAPHMPVVLVPGNHEYYGGSLITGMRQGAEAADRHPDVHLLILGDFVIGSVRFVGGTLWTDYELDAREVDQRDRDLSIAYAMQNAAGLLRDHTAIALSDANDPTGPFQPLHARGLHQTARRYIEGALMEPHEGSTVVATHHAPHRGSISRQFFGSPLNPAFASDLSELIWRYQPRLWIHGHMHNSAYYTVGETEIVCNPRGYGGENPDFNPALVLEV